MDPFVVMLLMIGAATAASAAERSPNLWRLYEREPWHFSVSWDWNAFSETFWASSLEEAMRMMDQDVEDVSGKGASQSEKHRVYAVVRGGQKMGPVYAKMKDRGGLLPAGSVVNVVWQAERDIDAIRVVLPWPLSVRDAVALAWEQEDPFASPELVVHGGEFVLVESL
jgi:hypothetical protein